MPQLVNDDGKPLCPNCETHPELFSDGACPVCDFVDDEVNQTFMEELDESGDDDNYYDDEYLNRIPEEED